MEFRVKLEREKPECEKLVKPIVVALLDLFNLCCCDVSIATIWGFELIENAESGTNKLLV